MSIDQRWTDQTEQLVATAICINAGHDCVVIEAHRMQARETLAALADAGLLLPLDEEANRQYGRLMPGGRVIPSARPDPTHYRLTGPWREAR